ncbi:MAG TPA: phosphodiester glycosidase family protein [Candidatus Udaeobacter sp.]|nr:phosphodiester glycosidase family protein [Candidatus Udaeobacter sp.]
MKRRAALLLFAVAATAHADWTIRSSDSEPGREGIAHRHVVLENASANQSAVVDLAIFSAKSCTLRVIDNPTGETLSDTMPREKCAAGVNGGYFSSDFAPIGLLVSGGGMIAPLQRARLITGVLSASARGVQILRVREFSRREKISAAVQCGPFLVDHYELVRGLDDSTASRRTFAATVTNDRALLGVCSEISLAELPAILATTRLADDLKIQRALNLDGGSSSAFWFARENGSAFSIRERKPVRDFVAVVPK